MRAISTLSRSVFSLLLLVGFMAASVTESRAEGATPGPAATAWAATTCRAALQTDTAARTGALTADCTTAEPIHLPNGWTLDGQRHTIQVVDPAGGRFRGGVIEVREGSATVRDLTIDGSALAPGCSPRTAVAGVLFVGAGGTVADVTIAGIRRGQGEHCGYGILIAGPGGSGVQVIGNTIWAPGHGGIVVSGATADVVDNSIVDAGGSGVVFCCTGTTGTIAGNDVVAAGEIGMLVVSGADVQITAGNRISGGVAGIVISGAGTRATIAGARIAGPAKDGIDVLGGAEVTVSRNTIDAAGVNGITLADPGTRGTIAGNTVTSAAVIGIWIRNGAQAEVRGNAITGPQGGLAGGIFGPFSLRFASGAGGSARENVISGYLSDRPTSLACAIAIFPDAGQVEIGRNVFLSPGNAMSVCEVTTPETRTIRDVVGTPVATPRP